MLLPSPIQATASPGLTSASVPNRSVIVSRSARSWQGWDESVSAFTTGTLAKWAISSSFECSKVRTTRQSR